MTEILQFKKELKKEPLPRFKCFLNKGIWHKNEDQEYEYDYIINLPKNSKN